MTCDTSRMKMSLGKWVVCRHLDAFPRNPRIYEWIWAPFAWNRQWSYRLVQNMSARCQGRRHPCKSMLLHYLHCLHQTSTRALWNGVHTPPTAELILNQKNLQMSRASKKMNAFLEESCDLKEDRSCSSPGKVSEYNWRLQKLACFQGLDLHNCWPAGPTMCLFICQIPCFCIFLYSTYPHLNDQHFNKNNSLCWFSSLNQLRYWMHKVYKDF